MPGKEGLRSPHWPQKKTKFQPRRMFFYYTMTKKQHPIDFGKFLGKRRVTKESWREIWEGGRGYRR